MQVVFGTGVLDLPRAFANLGWVLGVSALVVFGFLARYAGGLLYRVRSEFYPGTMSYAQAAEAAVGQGFSRVVAALVMANWFLMLPYYLVAAATAMRVAFVDSGGPLEAISLHQWLLALAFPLLVLLQNGTLHSISWVAALSNVSMLGTCALAMGSMVVTGPSKDCTRHLGPPPTDFLTAYTYMSSLIFAYQGHGGLRPYLRPPRLLPAPLLSVRAAPCLPPHPESSILRLSDRTPPACPSDMYYEVMREMRSSADFPRALSVANNMMVAAYLLLSATTYSVRGDDTPSFLLDAIPDPRLRTLASLLVVVHIVVTYLLVNQPLSEKIHRRVTAALLDRRWRQAQPARQWLSDPSLCRLAWLGVTLTVLLASLAIASLVPFFAVFQNMLGAVLGAPIVFGGPALLYLGCCRRFGCKMPLRDKMMCALFLCVLFPFCTAVGTWTAVQGLVREWRKEF